jgi:transcription-repair coupling factor (superfamily II helicase)
LAELEDRYGKAPEQVRNLIEVTELRQIANRIGLKDVNLLTGVARIMPVDLLESDQVRLSRQYLGLKYLQSAKSFQLPLPKGPDGDTVSGKALIEFAREIFEVIDNLQGEKVNE